MTDDEFPLIPVVLSGGSGTRLWPASRLSRPKQLLPLVNDRSMLEATIDRMAALGASTDPIVVANVDHADAVAREVIASGNPTTRLILEPTGRNTAPAVAVAAIAAIETAGWDDPLILVLPADHIIGNESAFRDAVFAASEAADAGYLVTFGITPSAPETGYGYIKVGRAITPAVRRVSGFKEKPDGEAAEQYISSGEYLWNSGMFLMKASRYLQELEQFAPDIASSASTAFHAGRVEGNRIYLDPDSFASSRSDSVDYAVMEHTSMAAVVPVNPDWSDVGSWASLWELADKDDLGNALMGDVLAVDTSHTYVRGADRLVATVGVEDLIIVDTPDAVLVARREAAQDVKGIVDILSESKRQELISDGTGRRSWGHFRTVDSGAGFSVLHLWVDPGGKTSLTTHTHRSENWLILNGIARITTDSSTRLVPSGESVSIPAGEIHRLENPGSEVLEVIEVAIGRHASEDDVTGHLNMHGRTEKNE